MGCMSDVSPQHRLPSVRMPRIGAALTLGSCFALVFMYHGIRHNADPVDAGEGRPTGSSSIGREFGIATKPGARGLPGWERHPSLALDTTNAGHHRSLGRNQTETPSSPRQNPALGQTWPTDPHRLKSVTSNASSPCQCQTYQGLTYACPADQCSSVYLYILVEWPVTLKDFQRLLSSILIHDLAQTADVIPALFNLSSVVDIQTKEIPFGVQVELQLFAPYDRLDDIQWRMNTVYASESDDATKIVSENVTLIHDILHVQGLPMLTRLFTAQLSTSGSGPGNEVCCRAKGGSVTYDAMQDSEGYSARTVCRPGVSCQGDFSCPAQHCSSIHLLVSVEFWVTQKDAHDALRALPCICLEVLAQEANVHPSLLQVEPFRIVVKDDFPDTGNTGNTNTFASNSRHYQKAVVGSIRLFAPRWMLGDILWKLPKTNRGNYADTVPQIFQDALALHAVQGVTRGTWSIRSVKNELRVDEICCRTKGGRFDYAANMKPNSECTDRPGMGKQELGWAIGVPVLFAILLCYLVTSRRLFPIIVSAKMKIISCLTCLRCTFVHAAPSSEPTDVFSALAEARVSQGPDVQSGREDILPYRDGRIPGPHASEYEVTQYPSLDLNFRPPDVEAFSPPPPVRTAHATEHLKWPDDPVK